MSRSKWLALTVVLLVSVRIGLWIYSGWGLITVQADDQPLSTVIASIEKQGKITIKSTIAPETPVTMHVKKVPLAEALETLSVLLDGNWRLQYFLAPDKTTLDTALAAPSGRRPPEGWKSIFYPLPPMFGSEEHLIDPRTDHWQVAAPAEKTLQAYLENAGRSVNAAFLLPETWNPSIAKAPGSGEIGPAVFNLAKQANGKLAEVFVLSSFRGNWGVGTRGDENNRPPQEGENRGQGEGGPSREFSEARAQAMAERVQAEIAKLPAAERAQAQQEFDQQRAFWEQLRNLPPEERRAKAEEFFNDPKIQVQREAREGQRDARRTPQQRFNRYKNYVQRRFPQGGAK